MEVSTLPLPPGTSHSQFAEFRRPPPTETLCGRSSHRLTFGEPMKNEPVLGLPPESEVVSLLLNVCVKFMSEPDQYV